MSDFVLEQPPVRTRTPSAALSERQSSALSFARDNAGEWFVYETETVGAGSKEDVSKARGRVGQKMVGLRKAAALASQPIETTVRRDGDSVKGFVRSVES